MSLTTKKDICSLARPPNNCKDVTFDVRNLMSQPNSWDCGVFAIVNATELVFGHDPAKCQWATGVDLIRHLIECFETGEIRRFLSAKQ